MEVDGKRLEQLRACAEGARARSYAPYSQFVVLAAVETVDGEMYGGSNIEIANFSLTKHAEEVAILAAIGDGHGPGGKWLRTLYVGGGPPCGSCRQFAAEFAVAEVVCVFERLDRATPPAVWKLSDLLPEAFEL
jgi:cytidine deaminase